ncbi:hypothetical protein CK228_24640 [Mesorhizobium sp. WSM4312]|uniref:hypothetical protein n=1 Tax=unclassified Mesorhizobium TaxID=325217 RepID=UPI000BAFDA18|nr:MULTISPECIES: hypothetical protein [unclassified Mesorhizobium]PBB65928.1 hypothetical protein CK228_24640 [Mesorhizobium sp. WSM4312]PBC20078.1 hypothetical protein CK226_25215 [Mesorhizobium sp. WSM4311]TRC71240.1 hypothetical protein FJV80_33705 [Mesorhizobium sp. WSM4310]TRC77912.1 hypothetical protein FJV81_09785 [Mesorhizobium sp. WSM4315]TRC78694.1 hypothetical protein FJV83_30115 [Mesorhizobium sp. WSM4307]
MTKLSDLGPLIPGKRHGRKTAREVDHFYSCPYCGQSVDQRNLRQVLWHAQAWHEPLDPEDGATIIMFPDVRR